MTVQSILPYVQIILSVILVIGVLLQQTGASLGGALGGDNFSAGYHTRRGAEKFLLYFTSIVGVLFAATAVATLFYR